MIFADAAEFTRFEREFKRLPHQLRAKAFSRAMRRVSRTVRTRVVRRSAERISIPQKFVRRTYTMLGTGRNTIEAVVRSGWIPLYKLGARQTRRGVTVRGRGRIDHAFIATMQSGHTGAFMRIGARRLPIRELFGPNPASDIANSPDVFEKVLVDVAETELAKRLLHETSRLLPR